MKKRKKILILVLGIPAVFFFWLCITVIAEMISDSKKTDIDYVPVTTHISEKKITFDIGIDDYVETDTTPLPISISNNKMKEFNRFLSDINVNYEYDALYNINEVYQRYKQINFNAPEKHTHDIRVNGKIDAQVLYNRVKENNTAFLKEHSLHKEYSNKKLKEYCNFIAENLPKVFRAYPQIDVDTVCCNLYDLKILDATSSLSLAAVNRNNVLCINEEFQEGSKILVDSDDIYTDTFYHELMHLCHFTCCDYNHGDDWVFGIGCEFEDIEINSLAWFWMEEASAELTKSYLLNVEPITYSSKIGYLESLNFILSLNKNNGLVQLEFINFQHDINNFFDLFGATTDEEVFRVIRLMYTLETYQSSPAGFYDAVLENYGVDLNNEQIEEDFRVTVRCDILEEFSVMFYRNLVDLINSQEMTLQDVYYIIRLYEADLNRHINTGIYGYMAVAEEFFEKYCIIQNEFFKLISEENGMESDALKTGFENYTMNTINDKNEQVSNYSLNFFSGDKRKWLDEFCQKIYKKGYPSMAECITLSRKCAEEISSWNNTPEITAESPSV